MNTEHAITDHDLQAALARELAATKDPLDATTDRERQTLTARRHALAQHVAIGPGLVERLATPTAKRIVVQAAIDRLRPAEAAIDKLIEDAPDYRTIADGRASSAEWVRQTGVIASKTALHRGVEYFNGKPALPSPLRELLTPPPCAACQRPHDVFWPGPIPELEAEITALDKQIAEAQWRINTHLGSARALLAGVGASEPQLR